MSQAPTETRPGYLVKRVQQLLRQACDEELRPTGLSLSQYAVLRALADRPGASSAELARLCFVTRQSLQDVLSGLRAGGLVAVADRPSAGRARPVTLTPAGRSGLRAAARAVDRVERRMVADLTPRDQRRLTDLLGACAANLV
ncbi:MarR family winged helix-turn-helix transcriptional regulator [Actinokineospora sp.]|uniref:MarR family winged helix-turn-helix transcriptional regulator n=1 Tax=Actinokineospora sp. TaxID=1872133 RepID=UPI00403821A9